MAKIEKIGNIQIVDNKEDKFFYFPMISMACTGIAYRKRKGTFNGISDGIVQGKRHVYLFERYISLFLCLSR